MKAMRRLLALVCIAVMILTATTPTSSLLIGILGRLDPLFGTILSVPLAPADRVEFGTDPFLSVRASRAPPLA